MDQVVLVDEQDSVIGTEEKMTVHKLGLLHRAFSVLVFRYVDNTLEFLLQQRQDNKYHSAGLWTNTCCSHPRLNEAILSAGQRRLQEELNSSMPLNYAGFFQYHAQFMNGLIEHEVDHVMVGEYDTNCDEIIINQEEIKAIEWVSMATLQEDLEVNPQKYTIWFRPVLDMALSIIKPRTLV